MPKYPWAVRAGGPLLGGGGAIFDWEPETAEALPATATFTRASIAQVLTTTDGTTNWYQEAKSGELHLDGLRRVETFIDAAKPKVSDFTNNTNGAGDTVTVTSGFTDPFGGTDADRVECSVNGSTSGDFALARHNTTLNSRNVISSIWMRSNTGSDQDVTLSYNKGASAVVTATAPWQRFAVLNDIGQISFDIGLRGDLTDASCDILVYLPQLEIQQVGLSLPSEYVDPATEYLNIGVNGVQYFNTTNGNSVDGSGVVTEATGATITGGGYLPEPAATNRLLHSNDLTQAAWVALGAATPNDLGVTDIGGQTTRVSGLGALGVDDIAQSVGGFTASGAVAPSVLLRRNSTTGTLRISSVGGLGNGEWSVDLSLIGAGWVRLEPGANVAGFSELTPWVADGAGNAGVVYSAAAGGPLTVDLAFNKTENTAFSTSPIITSGSTVTRVADVLTANTVLSGQTEFSIFADVTPPSVVGIDFGTDNSMWAIGADLRTTMIDNGGTRRIHTFNGVGFYDLDGGSLTDRFKVTTRFKSGDTKTFTSLGSQGETSVYTPSTSFFIGYQGSGNDKYFRGIQHNITAYAPALDDTQSQDLVA